MQDAVRDMRWRATPFYPDAVCDVCLSTEHVKIGLIKVVDRSGRPLPMRIRLWSLCDACHRLGSGLVIEQSVEGMLVYLAVRVIDGSITRCFVFAPMTFYEDRC